MKNLIDLHTHSVLSTHGLSTITENITYAKMKGLKYLGSSEHQYDDYGVGAHAFAFHNLKIVPKQMDDLHFLRGIEFNILPDGSIDDHAINFRYIDYGIASMHGYVLKDQGIKLNTEAYLKALDNEYVKIIGHPDDGHWPVDYEPIIKKAKEVHKLIEINNSGLRPTTNHINPRENMIEILRLCKKYNEPIIIDSDAHICYDIGNFEEAYELLKEQEFPMELVLNFNEDLIKEYFYSK